MYLRSSILISYCIRVEFKPSRECFESFYADAWKTHWLEHLGGDSLRPFLLNSICFPMHESDLGMNYCLQGTSLHFKILTPIFNLTFRTDRHTQTSQRDEHHLSTFICLIFPTFHIFYISSLISSHSSSFNCDNYAIF